jgi:hypothetical protein
MDFKKGVKNFFSKLSDLQKFLGIPILIFILIICGLLIINMTGEKISSFGEDGKVVKNICGDKTPSGNCSKNKPYYCEKGVLIENSISCGCPENFSINGKFCTSPYELSSREIFFDYVLRGEKKTISFTAYREVEEYVSNITRSITYRNGETPSRRDFKLREINDPIQREFLLPLVVAIQNEAPNSKEDQVRIAISLVQKIPFGYSEKKVTFGGRQIDFSRYAYNVVWDLEGICGEKSGLLAFLLKELGYKTVLFYHYSENHESVGIGCPIEYSIQNTGYCYVETTGSAILTDNEIEFVGGIKLESIPEIISISDGESLGEDMYEYKDAEKLIKINRIFDEDSRLNLYRQDQLAKLEKKYDLEKEYYIA